MTKVDCFKKLGQLVVCTKVDASAFIGSLDRWIRINGEMRKIIVDGGTHFVNQEVRGMLMRLGVQHTATTPYDYHNDGIVERCNRSILQLIRKNMVTNPGPRWWQSLRGVETQMNTSYQSELRCMP